MAERKRLVLDANILIRACLGVRVRALIADFANEVDFYVAEANAAEAAGYIGELATRRGLDPQICQEAFLSLMEVVQVVDTPLIEGAKDEALMRIRDPADWPALAWRCSWSARSGLRTRISLAPAWPPGPPQRWSVTSGTEPLIRLVVLRGQGLIDVSCFQLRVSLQDPFTAAAAGDQPHDRAHRDAQPADAGLAAHDGGIVADAGDGHRPRLRTKALAALLWIRLEPR
jgi:predicted nucleic acid-binding protein